MTPRNELATAINTHQASLDTADRLIRTYAGTYNALPSQVCQWVQLMDPDTLRDKATIIRKVGAEGRGPYQDAIADARFSELYSGWTGDGFDALALRWEGSDTSFKSYVGHIQSISASHADEIDTFLDDIEQLQRDCISTLQSDVAGIEKALAELDTFWENFWFGAGWGGSVGSIIGGAVGGAVGSPTGIGAFATAAVGGGIGLVAGSIVGGIIGGLFSAGTEDIEREFVESADIDFGMNRIIHVANGLTITNASETLGTLQYSRFSPYADSEITGGFVETENSP